MPNAIQLLAQKTMYELQRTVKFLYAKFHVLFKDIQRKIATKFISTLVLSLALENFICVKPNQKYLNVYSIGCSLANHDAKDPIVMQICLIARSALSGY